MQDFSLNIDSLDAKINFTKLSNRKFFEIYKKNSPIDPDWLFHMLLYQSKAKDSFSNLDLPRIYMSLYTLFGHHNNYDDYKCSFSYKFSLIIKRQKKEFQYALALKDWKGGMPDFTFYRTPVKGENSNTFVKPIDSEMTGDDLNMVILHFLKFLNNFVSIYEPYFNQPFFRVVRYAYLIYGYKDGSFFQNQFVDDLTDKVNDDEFRKQIADLEADSYMMSDMSKDFWD